MESDEDAARFVEERWPAIHAVLRRMGVPSEGALCCSVATMTTICAAMVEELDCPFFADMKPIDQAGLVISLARIGRERVTTEAVDDLLANIFNPQSEGEGQGA